MLLHIINYPTYCYTIILINMHTFYPTMYYVVSEIVFRPSAMLIKIFITLFPSLGSNGVSVPYKWW